MKSMVIAGSVLAYIGLTVGQWIPVVVRILHVAF